MVSVVGNYGTFYQKSFGQIEYGVAFSARHRGFEKVSFEKYLESRAVERPVAADEYVDIQMPQRADSGSCAYDFYCPRDITIQPNEQILIWTGVKVYMQSNEAFIINVRSNQGKARVQLANTQGWIDSTYYDNKSNEGNLGVFLRNESDKPYEIKKGERFCQGMFLNYLVADDDKPISEQREGGFGSSGK